MKLSNEFLFTFFLFAKVSFTAMIFLLLFWITCSVVELLFLQLNFIYTKFLYYWKKVTALCFSYLYRHLTLREKNDRDFVMFECSIIINMRQKEAYVDCHTWWQIPILTSFDSKHFIKRDNSMLLGMLLNWFCFPLR